MALVDRPNNNPDLTQWSDEDLENYSFDCGLSARDAEDDQLLVDVQNERRRRQQEAQQQSQASSGRWEGFSDWLQGTLGGSLFDPMSWFSGSSGSSASGGTTPTPSPSGASSSAAPTPPTPPTPPSNSPGLPQTIHPPLPSNAQPTTPSSLPPVSPSPPHSGVGSPGVQLFTPNTAGGGSVPGNPYQGMQPGAMPQTAAPSGATTPPPTSSPTWTTSPTGPAPPRTLNFAGSPGNPAQSNAQPTPPAPTAPRRRARKTPHMPAFRPGGGIGQGMGAMGSAPSVGNIQQSMLSVADMSDNPQIRAVADTLKVIVGAPDAMRDWIKGLHQSNMEFTEFSGQMAEVQAKQQGREVELAIERGDRRAQGADELAEAMHAMNVQWAKLEDNLMGVLTDVAKYLAKILEWMIKLVNWFTKENLKEDDEDDVTMTALHRKITDMKAAPDNYGLPDWAKE